jgi:hypothetical protein
MGRKPTGDARFLEPGWFAVERPFRESDDRSVPCILDRPDVLALAERASSRREPLDGFVVPSPPRLVKDGPRPSWLPSWLGLVDATSYDKWLGLRVHQESSDA